MCGNRLAQVMLIAFSVLQSGVLTAGEGKRGAIAGRVMEEGNGRPLPWTRVTAVQTGMSALTDLDGYYLIEDVPSGTYDVRASHPQCEPLTVSQVSVGHEQTALVNFKLMGRLEASLAHLDSIDFGPDSLADSLSCPIDLRLWAAKDTFDWGERIDLWCEMQNTWDWPVIVLRRQEGSECESRTPYYRLYVVSSSGDTIRPRGVGCPSYWNPLWKLLVLLRSGQSLDPYGGRIPVERSYGALWEPGRYRISLRFKCNSKGVKRVSRKVLNNIVNCDITTEPVEITVLGE